MYDIAPRVFEYKSTTGELVGPNTYVVCQPRPKKQSWAPFLFSKPKAPSFVTPLNTDAIYDTRSYSRKLIGGTSLQDKAARFNYKTDLTPCPTKYNAKPICCKKKLIFDPTKPKLYACAVPYSTSVIAPSIPSKNDEAGYDIGEDGEIIKIPPQKHSSVGINIKSRIGKGIACKWSKRTAERFRLKQYETPGPGPAASSSELPKRLWEEEYEKCREMARRESYVPRYVEAQELKAAKEKRPGPGSYDIQTIKTCCRRGRGIQPRSCLRPYQKITIKKEEPPGPTTYNICDCYRIKKDFSMKCVPFRVEAERFRKSKKLSTPGPGDYGIPDGLKEKLAKKINPYASCIPPFNSTVDREINFVLKDSLFMPSSADYPEDVNEDDKTLPISYSVFVNNVCRFYSPADKKDYIGPARYNTSESFSKNRDRKSFNVVEIAFNMSGLRSTTPTVKVGVPCPTTYKNEKELGCNGYHFAISPRFACEEETPGPGSYKIHPRILNSTYKAVDTHNLRLKENILRKKLRLAPKATRKCWIDTMRKKKLLKWFDTELDYEERMIMLIQELFDKPV